MKRFLYKYRSTKQLLDQFHELENQELYFASPEELNDPMEGYKDIFWSGDAIVWRNLLKHFILSLEHVFCIFSLSNLSGNTIDLKTVDLPIFKTENDLPDPHKGYFNEICSLFFSDKQTAQYPDQLAKINYPIRADELTSHLQALVLHALLCIIKVHSLKGLMQKLSDETLNALQKESQKRIKSDMNAIKILRKMKKEARVDLLAESVHLVSKHDDNQCSKIHNKVIQCAFANKLNQKFLLLYFAEKYVANLKKIIHPNCYITCFSADYKNASMWGHYADSHKGICLKFKTHLSHNKIAVKLQTIQAIFDRKGQKEYVYNNAPFTARKVIYHQGYPQIDFFRYMGRLSRPQLISWYQNNEGAISTCSEDVFKNNETWMEKYWASHYENISIKLKDWNYEKEYRLVLNGMSFDYSEKIHRKLKYDFSDLDGIIFGIQTTEEDKQAIIKIIEEKCKGAGRKNFDFYQAYYCRHSRKIKSIKMNMLDINN